jgi:hypothetical protein
MQDTSNKLRLSENHRRVVSVVIREVEKMCGALLDWLDKKPTLLNRIENDLTVEQQAKLRKLVEQLRGEIRRFNDEVTLDAAMQSRRRAIDALISANMIHLEEVNSGSLKAYGQLSEEVGRELDAKFARLITLLETMRRAVEEG